MHAMVIHASTWPRQRGLDEQVLPMIKGAAGFLGAYFVAADRFSIQVFETEEQAGAAAPPKGAEAPGVTLDTLQFGRGQRLGLTDSGPERPVARNRRLPPKC